MHSCFTTECTAASPLNAQLLLNHLMHSCFSTIECTGASIAIIRYVPDGLVDGRLGNLPCDIVIELLIQPQEDVTSALEDVKSCREANQADAEQQPSRQETCWVVYDFDIRSIVWGMRHMCRLGRN